MKKIQAYMASDGQLFLNSIDCAEYEFITKNKKLFESFAMEVFEILYNTYAFNSNIDDNKCITIEQAQCIYTLAIDLKNKLDSEE
jgi:hypothetical protein